LLERCSGIGLVVENCKIDRTSLGSVYVEGGVIKRVSDSTTQDVPSGTSRIDGHGGALYPGFTDTHCHPFELGLLKKSVDLRGTSNITGVRLRLAAAVRKTGPGEWILGRGWDHEAMSEKRLPSREDIDDISKSNPVILTRVCGHISLLNTMAIQNLGIQDKTGLGFDRSTKGGLTGIVREAAQEEVFRAMPGPTPESCLEALMSVEYDAAKSGLTELHCILSEDAFRQELEALVQLSSRPSSLRYRVYIPVAAVDFVKSSGINDKLAAQRLQIAGVKVYADGSLGASTAALREPYEDDKSNTGILRYSADGLDDAVERAVDGGYQLIIHAIGDRAIEQAIEALSKVTNGGNPRRHRIEHASLLPRDLRSKMRRHDIHATVQPCFVTSDTWAVQRLGEERVRYLYPFKSMIQEGIVVSGGSDAPVETISPIIGMWSSMTRGGREDEALNLDQAIALYTTNAAVNGFEENEAKIVEGGRGDLTLLDSDIDEMHPAMFRKVGVAATILGGELAYSFEGSPDLSV
jgi:predicted amidohydrolase YtcJ